MENQRNKSYAIYTFIRMEKEEKWGVAGNTFSESYTNPIIMYKVKNYLISYAIKRYFNKEIQEKKPMQYLKNGIGFIEGIYFSVSHCLRVVCVCVSKSPVGICAQIQFPMLDEAEYSMHNFCENELKEYRLQKYKEETYFYLYCQKKAYQKKHGLLYEDLKEIDSTQESYTFLKETFFDKPFFFAATGNVEFEKIEDEVISLN